MCQLGIIYTTQPRSSIWFRAPNKLYQIVVQRHEKQIVCPLHSHSCCEALRASLYHSPQITYSSKSTCFTWCTPKSGIYVALAFNAGRLTHNTRFLKLSTFWILVSLGTPSQTLPETKIKSNSVHDKITTCSRPNFQRAFYGGLLNDCTYTDDVAPNASEWSLLMDCFSFQSLGSLGPSLS